MVWSRECAICMGDPLFQRYSAVNQCVGVVAAVVAVKNEMLLMICPAVSETGCAYNEAEVGA